MLLGPSPLRFLSPLLLFLSGALPGCGPGAAPCPAGFLGAAGTAPELAPAVLDRDGARLVPLAAGDTVELARPIQGGHVLFVGAFVRGVLSCGGSLRGELRRDSGGAPGGILVSDERSSELQPVAAGRPTPAGGGWGSPAADINEMPNVPACPNVLPDEFLDGPAWLRLTFTARDGVTATGEVRVVPRCLQPDGPAQMACRCECQAGYTIDRCLM